MEIIRKISPKPIESYFEEVRNADENVNVIMGVGGYLGDKEVYLMI